MEKDDDVAVAEAGGGGNKLPPPVEVICGDDPEQDPARKIRDAHKREVQAAALRVERELERRIRNLDRRRPNG